MICIPRKELKDFLDDMMTLIAGISWFNVDKEKKRAYDFFDKYMLKIVKSEKLEALQTTPVERNG